MLATNWCTVSLRLRAISRKPFQNASSILMLVLRPAMTIERLTTNELNLGPSSLGGLGTSRRLGELRLGPFKVGVHSSQYGGAVLTRANILCTSTTKAVRFFTPNLL